MMGPGNPRSQPLPSDQGLARCREVEVEKVISPCPCKFGKVPSVALRPCRSLTRMPSPGLGHLDLAGRGNFVGNSFEGFGPLPRSRRPTNDQQGRAAKPVGEGLYCGREGPPLKLYSGADLLFTSVES